MTTKVYTPTISLLLLCGLASGQGTWTQKADCGGVPRWETIGFSIGDKGYFALGSFQNDIWEYDPITDSWEQKTSLPVNALTESTGFVLNGKAYMQCSGDSSLEFWEYDPSIDTWTPKAYWGYWLGDPSAFSINGKGYFCNGWNSGDCGKELWEYDPVSNSWTQKADLPECRTAAVAFTIGNFAYVGTGVNPETSETGTKEFWKYDPSIDTWTQIADFGGEARREAVAFTINNRAYVGTGVLNFDTGGSTTFKDFWEYIPSTDSWVQVADFLGSPRGTAGSFSIGNKGYVGTGGSNDGSKDFWEYTPGLPHHTGIKDLSNQYNLTIYPNPFSKQTILQFDKVLKDATLTLYNSLGQQVRQVNNISGHTLTLNRDNLPSGLYYLQLTQDNQTIATDKLVITD